MREETRSKESHFRRTCSRRISSQLKFCDSNNTGMTLRFIHTSILLQACIKLRSPGCPLRACLPAFKAHQRAPG
jgi:hypothetical protein